MKHSHLLECPSTQTFLKEHIEKKGWNGAPVLVSTSHQTEGRGRRQNSWFHSANALAFSLALDSHPQPMLTPLEMGSILINYFSHHSLSLKWPNDLVNSHGQKCGGILCSLLNDNIVVVGIGINWGQSDFPPFPQDAMAPGCIDRKKILTEQDKKNFPLDISQYIVKNRMTTEQVLQTWDEHCFHKNKQVVIRDGDDSLSGFFRGISPQGEAIIDNDGVRKHISTGSLVVCSSN